MEMNPNDEGLLAEEVNRRYWDSGQSVNQIADALGISKGALYTLLDVMPAGAGCPRCGRELGYPNRTAREKGFVTCVACGFEEDLQILAADAGGGPEAAQPAGATAGEEGEGALAQPGAPAAPAAAQGAPGLPVGTASLAGAALVGLAVGVLLGSWFSGRR
ncbi:MAG: hypothetical protein HY704_00560 [Gemmatimonadetes bacterium]|nr:hypothetical protein [Gemmatimonadota bacterium]